MQVSMKNDAGLIRQVKVGFCWTAFFFGPFPFFFRGMPGTGFIWCLFPVIGNFVLPFRMNKYTAHYYLEHGYKPIGSGWDVAGPSWGVAVSGADVLPDRSAIEAVTPSSSIESGFPTWKKVALGLVALSAFSLVTRELSTKSPDESEPAIAASTPSQDVAPEPIKRANTKIDMPTITASTPPVAVSSTAPPAAEPKPPEIVVAASTPKPPEIAAAASAPTLVLTSNPQSVPSAIKLATFVPSFQSAPPATSPTVTAQVAVADTSHRDDTAADAKSAPASWAPSFDCTKKLSGTERLICSNPELSAADVKLNQVYRLALASSSDQGAAVKRSQLEWMRNDRNVCSDAGCVRDAYARRINALSE